MMSRSFRENSHQKKMDDIRKELKEVEEAIAEKCNIKFSEYMTPLVKFYEAASQYLEVREQILVSAHSRILTYTCLQLGKVT